MSNHYRIAVAGLALGALSLLGSGCSSVSSDGKEWVPTQLQGEGEKVSQTAQPLSGTHKICSVYFPGAWRDSLIVGQGWNSGMCLQWMGFLGATGFNLGCMTDTGAVLGSAGGGTPSPNCGW